MTRYKVLRQCPNWTKSSANSRKSARSRIRSGATGRSSRPISCTEFFETDIKPSQTLKSRGIEAHFADNKLILHKPQSGHYEEPLYIVVGEQGEIDIAGRSLGRYQPAEKLGKKARVDRRDHFVF